MANSRNVLGLAFASVLTLSGCCGPNTCPEAVNTFTQLEPVTKALISYQTDHGQPPDNLFELNDGYLPQGIRIMQHRQGPTIFFAESATWKSRAFSYKEINPKEYEIFFGYNGPGTNSCNWTTFSQAWMCGGGL